MSNALRLTSSSFVQEEQPIAALIALNQHLEGGRFQAFWQAADSCRDILGSVPGYYDAIRRYIVGAMSSTCQKVSKTLLGEILHLDGAQLDQLVRCYATLEANSDI